MWVDRTGEPPLHKQVQRDANSKALKAQPPPSWGMPWDHDGDRDGSIPTTGSWTEIQNIALEQLLQLQWTPRCCGSVTDPWGLSGLPSSSRKSSGLARVQHVPEAVLLQHGSGTAAGQGGLLAACGRALCQPRSQALSPLPRLLLSRKTARPGAW